MLEKQECPYFRGSFESFQNIKFAIWSDQRRLPSGRDTPLPRPGKGGSYECNGRTGPCGAAVAQTGGKRS